MSYITISKKKFYLNLEIISKMANGLENVALVLKDNAYGHGLRIIAKLASEYGIRHAVVRTFYEATEIETLFESVLVLSDIQKVKCNNSIHFTINSLEDIDKVYKGASVELKVDTGMNRNGITQSELGEALEKINLNSLLLKGLFTHHSSADLDDEKFNFQNDKFVAIKEKVLSFAKQNNWSRPRVHSSNSAALFRKGIDGEDIARVGIAAYGCLQMPEKLTHEHLKLKPILSLYSHKISTRTLKGGGCVGYNEAYTANCDEVVSTYDIGYADGFSRLQDNINYITPNGYRLLGRVSMDSISLSSEDDEVLLFDDAREYSKVCNTISYEVLVRLSANISRKVE